MIPLRPRFSIVGKLLFIQLRKKYVVLLIDCVYCMLNVIQIGLLFDLNIKKVKILVLLGRPSDIGRRRASDGSESRLFEDVEHRSADLDRRSRSGFEGIGDQTGRNGDRVQRLHQRSQAREKCR